MASSVPNSCRAWNCGVSQEAIGHLGDIEHMRSFLPGEGEVLEPGQLYWITDRTPHESLPLKERTYRQFFRIVTSDVSLWYRDHSTANPLGVVPDPDITKIVAGNKFSDEGVEIIFPEGTPHPGSTSEAAIALRELRAQKKAEYESEDIEDLGLDIFH